MRRYGGCWRGFGHHTTCKWVTASAWPKLGWQRWPSSGT